MIHGEILENVRFGVKIRTTNGFPHDYRRYSQRPTRDAGSLDVAGIAPPPLLLDRERTVAVATQRGQLVPETKYWRKKGLQL